MDVANCIFFTDVFEKSVTDVLESADMAGADVSVRDGCMAYRIVCTVFRQAVGFLTRTEVKTAATCGKEVKCKGVDGEGCQFGLWTTVGHSVCVPCSSAPVVNDVAEQVREGRHGLEWSSSNARCRRML